MTHFSPRGRWAAFLVVFSAALLFALYTRHAWEDYWITFRASRNFAEGHGLVFNPGDRLHTFTSPLGVLLPALAFVLTGNNSDYAALWIFRVMSATALGGAAWLLFSGVRKAGYTPLVGTALIAFVACDAKALDFTINGMETGFLLLFLAWIFHTLLTRPARPWLHLGLAWGGMMWTRPDSFIYVGALCAGVLLFHRGSTGPTRAQWIKTFLAAGIVTVAVYSPWLIATKLYYGTPVPHTIIAKGFSNPPITWDRFQDFAGNLPRQTWAGGNSFAAAFLPSYFMGGGWPGWTIKVAAALAILCSLAWVLPFLRWEGRVASLAFLVGHIYLSFVPYFPFPWYLPTTTLLGLIVLAASAQTLRGTLAGIQSAGVTLALLATLGLGLIGFALFSGRFVVGSARQLAAAQRWIEDGNRKQIGLYLREHAGKTDTVFLEPLGYIGYFSQLKTYDFPGMSSREMVAARKQVGSNWADLINYLRPDWIVVRDDEKQSLMRSDSGICDYRYREEKVFDVSESLQKLDVPGKNYLEVDRRFTLLRRAEPVGAQTAYGEMRGKFLGGEATKVADIPMIVIHAPGELIVPIPEGATEVTIHYGFPEATYRRDEEYTDGARFSLHMDSGQSDYQIWTRTLQPRTVVADQGSHTIVQKLPPHGRGAKLLLRTVSEKDYTRDWTSWSAPVFK